MEAKSASVETIFGEALNLSSAEERAAYLDRACGGDIPLRRQVETLLGALERAGDFLASPNIAVTADQPRVTEGSSTVIGPYKLLQEIGEGGMGTVWMGEQTEPVKRVVALKVIKAGLDSRQVLARFGAERQALALMDHPNIARVLDAGATEQGRPYFVMELVKGVPIARYCDEQHLTPRERLELFIPVCQAVQHAHQKGIIHRDLKPSNVLIGLCDGKPVPKVIDFGVAKAAGPKLTEATFFTEFGAVIGTPEYMSPEQAQLDNLDIDTRSDIYSLGVLLYELLTGTTPFTRKDLEKAGMLEMLRVIREQEPTKPSTKLSTAEGLPTLAANRGTEPAKLTKLVRGELDWIVMKALEKDRNRRYESASAFAADVQRYVADEPVQACPPSASYRLGKVLRRHKRALAAAAVVSLAILLAVAAVAGSLGLMARDRSVRRAKLNSEVESALQEAVRNRELALKQSDNAHQWEATLAASFAALKRGERIAAQDESGLDPSVLERLHAVRATLDADENDRRFVARVDEIRLEQSDVDQRTLLFDRASALPKIRRALHEHYRIDVGATPSAQAAATIRARPEAIQPYLVTTLDVYMQQVSIKEADVRAWLNAVIAGADSNPWRQRARHAVASGAVAALREVVEDAAAMGQPLMLLHALAVELPIQENQLEIELSLRLQRACPSDFWTNFHLATAFERSAPPRWDEAIRYFTAALALRPRNTAVYRALGIAQLRKGDLAAAVTTFQQALAIDPGDASVHNSLGNALKKNGARDAGMTEYRKAIELHSSYALPHYNLGLALKEKGLLSEAIAEFRRSIELDPDYYFAHKILGVVLSETRDFDGAIDACRKAIALCPTDSETHFNLGVAQSRAGNRAAAIASLRRCIRIDPKYARAHNNLGLLLKKANPDEAADCFRAATKSDPGLWQPHSNLGDLLAQQGDLAGAIAAYREAARLSPDTPRLQRALAETLSRAGRLDEAIACLRHALEREPKDARTHRQLGISLQKQRKFREAIRAYRSAINLKSDYGQAHVDLAWLLANAPDPKDRAPAEAVILAKKAVELAPEGISGWGTLGMAQYRARNWALAVTAINRAMELSRGGVCADWLFAAMTHWQLGNRDEARTWYEKAVAWMEKEQSRDDELREFQIEAAELLGIDKKKK
jgi:tetratricopeptide (TPR) repeat protein